MKNVYSDDYGDSACDGSDDDDDELFLQYGCLAKGVQSNFQAGPLSEILTIANL